MKHLHSMLGLPVFETLDAGNPDFSKLEIWVHRCWRNRFCCCFFVVFVFFLFFFFVFFVFFKFCLFFFVFFETLDAGNPDFSKATLESMQVGNLGPQMLGKSMFNSFCLCRFS